MRSGGSLATLARGSDRLLTWAVMAGGALGSLAIAVMLISSVFEMVARKLGHPTLWSYDMNIYALLVLTFLTLAAVERDGEHMNVDLFSDHLPASVTRVIYVITGLVSLAFVLLLAWEGWRVAQESATYGRTAGGGVKVAAAAVEMLVPIGAILLALELVRRLVRLARGAPPRRGATEGEPTV